MSMRDEIAKKIVQGIRAWHASPHDFDRFDLSKIGSGQGAASYGRGIYAAENPAVSGVGGEYWKEFAGHFTGSGPGIDPVMSHAVQYLEHLGGDRKAALEMVKGAIEKTGNFPQRPRLEAVRDLLASDKQVGPRVYELNIKADPQSFLQWDKPLKDQMQHVEALPRLLDAAKEEAYQRALSATSKPRADELWGMVKEPERATGEFAFRHFGKDAEGAMRRMQEADIPGIRYLDQGSRPTADLIKREQDRLAHWQSIGAIDTPQYREVAARMKQAEATPLTYNYVINDPDKIDILKKYGIPGALGAGTMGELARQDQYQ